MGHALPGGQFTHAVAPPRAYRPVAQGVPLLVVRGHALPEGHRVQAEAPDRAKLPNGHWIGPSSGEGH